MPSKNTNIEKSQEFLVFKLLRGLFATTFWIVSLVVVLVIGLLITLQVDSSRKLVINKILGIVNNSLVAKIEVADIDFSSFPNIKIFEAKLITGADTLANVATIYAEPNLNELLNGTISVKNIFLQSPDIKLIRDNQGVWNFSKIAKPAKPDSSEASNVVINLGELLINNAKIDLIDSLEINREIISDKEKVNYKNMKLRDLSLKLQADFQTKELLGKVNIKHLQFYDEVSNFVLLNLGLNAELTKEGLLLNKLKVITEKTSLDLDGKVNDLVLSKGISAEKLRNLHIELNINPSVAYIRDVEYFAPTTLQKDLIVGLSGKAYGSLNELYVENLNLKPENSNITINTKLFNLGGGGEFRYKGNITNTKIYRNDIKKILNPNIANSLPNFDILNLNNLYFDGTTKTLEADINMESSLGNLKGKVSLVYRPVLKYNADLIFKHLDLSKVIRNDDLNSNLNGDLKVNGIGVDYKKMIADLRLNLYKSNFQKYNLDTLNLFTKVNNSQLELNKLSLILPADYYSEYIKLAFDESPKVEINGNIDFKNLKNPIYNLNIETEGLNVAKLTDNPESIEYFTSKIQVAGEGFDTKGFYLKGQADINDLVFKDKSAMPFSVDLLIDTKNPERKTINISSELANIFMYGDFNLESLISFGSHQSKVWSNLLQNRIEKIKNANYEAVVFNEEMIPASFSLNADIKDLSFVNIFLEDMNIYSNLKIKLNADIHKEKAYVNLDTININKLQFESKGMKLNLSDINMRASMNINSDSTKYYLDTLFINIPQNGLIVFNEMRFVEPFLQVTMDDKEIDYRVGLNMDHTMYFVNRGKINFNDEYLALQSDLLNFKFRDILNLSNYDTLDIRYNDGNIHIQNFSLADQNNSKISATGDLINGVFSNMQVKVSEMKISDIDSMLRKITSVELNKIEGEIENLSIVANGELSKPRYNISLNTSNIKIDKQNAGKINLDLNYSNKNIYGSGKIIDTKTNKQLLDLAIRSFPIDLAIGDTTELISKKLIDLDLKTDSLSMGILSPFVPVLDDIHGIMNLTLTAKGKDFNNLDYKGELNIPSSNFLLNVNNLRYYAYTNITFNREKIKLSKLNISNDRNDLAYGSADISGEIKMNGFELLNYDFILKTNALMVLGNASAKAIPSIYGKLVIATGMQPLKVVGSLNYLNVNGDVNVLNGALTMPKVISSSSVDSKMLYKVASKLDDEELIYNIIDNATGDTLYSELKNKEFLDNTRDSLYSNENETQSWVAKSNMANNMFINMNFKVLNPISLRIDLGDLGKLTAKIGTENQYYPLSLNYSPNKGISVLGDIKLLPGSKLSYLKQFDTEGSISFPLGSVSNPKLNLKAVYNGKSYLQELVREFKVFMYINGFLKLPNIRFDYEFEGEPSKGDSTQVFQDALSLIIFGRTKTEMEAGMKTSSAEYGSLGIGMLTNQFSDFLSTMLQGTGSIESVNIDMGTGNRWEEARLRATGRLFDRIGWRYGSDLNDLSQNAEFSLEVPLNIVLDSNYLNNIVWQFSTSSNIQQTAINRNQKDWEIKLRFGGNW